MHVSVHTKVADAEIASNRALFDHEGGQIENANPLLVKFRYIESKGLKREWSQQQSKTLTGDAPVKKVAQLSEAKAFLECLGAPGHPGSSDTYTRPLQFACTEHRDCSACSSHACMHACSLYCHIQCMQGEEPEPAQGDDSGAGPSDPLKSLKAATTAAMVDFRLHCVKIVNIYAYQIVRVIACGWCLM